MASWQSRGLPPAPGGFEVPALVQEISVQDQKSEMLRGLFQAGRERKREWLKGKIKK